MLPWGQQGWPPHRFVGAPWKFPTFWYSPRLIADWRAETSLLLSCLLNEFTFFLTLIPFPHLWGEQLWVEQERLCALSQFLSLHDLLLLWLPTPPHLPSHRPHAPQEPQSQQLCVLHLIVSEAGPEQLPPEQLLERLLSPPPQVAEQVLHDPQVLHLPPSLTLQPVDGQWPQFPLPLMWFIW